LLTHITQPREPRTFEDHLSLTSCLAELSYADKDSGTVAILLFLVWIVAVLQGWSKNSVSGRFIATGFVVALGFAALWGVRALLGFSR
jgi:hypothetical protein